MAWIREILPEEADGEVRDLYDRVADPDGTVDHILRVHGIAPTTLRDHFALYRTLMKRQSPLTRVQREMAAVLVSAINECHY